MGESIIRRLGAAPLADTERMCRGTAAASIAVFFNGGLFRPPLADIWRAASASRTPVGLETVVIRPERFVVIMAPPKMGAPATAVMPPDHRKRIPVSTVGPVCPMVAENERTSIIKSKRDAAMVSVLGASRLRRQTQACHG